MRVSSDRYRTTCSEGHPVLPMITPAELQQGLSEGWLRFYCDRCGRDWRPSADERARAERWLDERHTVGVGP